MAQFCEAFPTFASLLIMDAYDELAANPAATLARLNPAHQDDSVNCPQTADVVDNYLNTNTVVPVTNGYFDSFRI